MERRYKDHEVREILDLAIGGNDPPARSLPAADGLTLGELQEIGAEVGVSPDRMRQAATAFEGRGAVLPRGKTVGLPTSVGTVVPLPRSPSDREWELLVSEFRTTFGGKGEVTAHGGLREWSHGTVHAFIEPTETGQRLRLTDSGAPALGALATGGFFVAFAIMILFVLLGKGELAAKFAVPAMFSLIGGGLVVGTAVGLPKWAREQERRMESVNRYAAGLLASPAPNDEAG